MQRSTSLAVQRWDKRGRGGWSRWGGAEQGHIGRGGSLSEQGGGGGEQREAQTRVRCNLIRGLESSVPSPSYHSHFPSLPPSSVALVSCLCGPRWAWAGARRGRQGLRCVRIQTPPRLVFRFDQCWRRHQLCLCCCHQGFEFRAVVLCFQ